MPCDSQAEWQKWVLQLDFDHLFDGLNPSMARPDMCATLQCVGKSDHLLRQKQYISRESDIPHNNTIIVNIIVLFCLVHLVPLKRQT